MAVRVAPSGVVTFLFTDIEGSTRRSEATPTGCGLRSPPTTRYSVTRSRRTEAGCSSTPATACAPPSRPLARSRCGDSRAAGTRVAGPDGHRDRRSRAARGGLFRSASQSRGAGDGGGPAFRRRRLSWHRVPDPGPARTVWSSGVAPSSNADAKRWPRPKT
jgi:hypothetical protein